MTLRDMSWSIILKFSEMLKYSLNYRDRRNAIGFDNMVILF